MKKTRLFLIILILSTALFSAPLTTDVGSASESEDVDVLLNPGYYRDQTGFTHVVGEVKNKGKDMLEQVRIEVTFYDSKDTVPAYITCSCYRGSFLHIDRDGFTRNVRDGASCLL